MNAEVLERVLHLSRSMAETRTLSPLLDYAMDEAMSLVNAKRGFIVLLNDDGSLDFRVKRGSRRDGTTVGEDQISTSILGHVVESGQPIIINDASADPKWNKESSVAFLGLRSVMCVPLIARGKTIGGIYVENRDVRNCFSEDDLPPLILFANQAAVSIENAALNDALEARVEARTRELQLAKAELEENWHKAIEVNRHQTLLFGNVAHDVRAPLSVVVSTLRLMLEGAFGDLTADQIEWLNKALHASSIIQTLTTDMFDLTKIELGHLALIPEPIQPNDFLTQVYEVGTGLPWTAGVNFQLDVPDVLPEANFDPRRITQVLVNLLSNALKFTSQGSVTLYARALEAREGLLLGVRDTGEGIAHEYLDKLFQPFHQVDEDEKRRRLGTGLGLAICRELVEMHGGRIWVESERGSGSDFKFVLPWQ